MSITVSTKLWARAAIYRVDTPKEKRNRNLAQLAKAKENLEIRQHRKAEAKRNRRKGKRKLKGWKAKIRAKLLHHRTKPELLTAAWLKRLKIPYLEQWCIGNYFLDIYLPQHKIAIELDGKHHAEAKQRHEDQKRERQLNRRGIAVLRVWNQDFTVDNREAILRQLEQIKEGQTQRFKADQHAEGTSGNGDTG